MCLTERDYFPLSDLFLNHLKSLSVLRVPSAHPKHTPRLSPKAGAKSGMNSSYARGWWQPTSLHIRNALSAWAWRRDWILKRDPQRGIWAYWYCGRGAGIWIKAVAMSDSIQLVWEEEQSCPCEGRGPTMKTSKGCPLRGGVVGWRGGQSIIWVPSWDSSRATGVLDFR